MADVVKSAQDEADAITPYSMHVSSKYMELTKKKLELTRLPRELELPERRRWDQGTPKAVLEPLLDYWLEHYDWRTQEKHFNSALPQFRTTISLPFPTNPDTSHSLRIHFVHKRSKHTNAVPLLFCHTWPSSFIEVQKIIDALTDPHSLPSFGAGAQQAFHIVAPSIPGFGFSDASPMEDFGLKDTAEVFNSVMQRLGYEHYVAHGVGWGFSICRALAMNHPQHCLAVHTANPAFATPTFKRTPVAYLKYRIARLTRAKVPLLSFGYIPAELQSLAGSEQESLGTSQGTLPPRRPLDSTLAHLYSYRPQTLAFCLCDSPAGLLSGILDVIHARAPAQSPVTSRCRSPFLSPIELEMQDSHRGRSSQDNEIHSSATERLEQPLSPRESEIHARNYTWSPIEILNWTMMQWLPGPEASLRWLRRAYVDSSPASQFPRLYCHVPLGISSFRARNSRSCSTPLAWGSASWRVAWVKRHQRPASLPAWEAPDLLVLDMRECFGTFLSHGTISDLPTQAT